MVFNEVHGLYGLGFWKNIRSWGELSSHTRFEVGDGSKFDSSMMYGVGIKSSR